MINLSPFEVELDRAAIRFWCGGTIQNSSYLERTIMSSGQIVTLRISEGLADGHARQIARTLDNHNSAIEGVLEFNSKLHSFTNKELASKRRHAEIRECVASAGQKSGLRKVVIGEDRIRTPLGTVTSRSSTDINVHVKIADFV